MNYYKWRCCCSTQDLVLRKNSTGADCDTGIGDGVGIVLLLLLAMFLMQIDHCRRRLNLRCHWEVVSVDLEVTLGESLTEIRECTYEID